MKIIIFIVALMIILGIIYKIHHYFLNKISYNNVIKESIFNNNNKGYLNVGLWKTQTNNLYDAQKMMYLMFFSFAELHNPNQKVLETGCGSAEHYLLWKKYGLQSKMECYEIRTNIHPEVKKMSDNVTIYQKSALELDRKEEFNKIISIESAFHYPNRQLFFKKCYNALKSEGMLFMVDIVKNKNCKYSGFLPNIVQNYYENYIFKMPKENSIGIEEYYQQLIHSGFKSVYISDITEKTLQPFYQNYYKNINNNKFFGLNNRWANYLHDKFISSMADLTTCPFSYIMIVCLK